MDLIWLSIDLLFSVCVYWGGFFGLVLLMEVYGVEIYVDGVILYIRNLILYYGGLLVLKEDLWIGNEVMENDFKFDFICV